MSVDIRISHALKKFGNSVIIPDLNVDIRPGEFFTLLGPSGCGKTTLLRMIAGFNSIEGGDFYFGDKRINDLDPAKRNIGMVFQNYAIFPHYTVRKNVEFGLKNRHLPKDEIKINTDKFLKLMQIDQLADRLPDRLSGGQQQRVALARALCISPDVLLMDEPLSNLDAKLRVEMRTVIKNIQHDVGITCVYVTHDQLEAMTLSTRVSLMDAGVLQQYAPPLEIYNCPANLFVASFMGNPTMNFIPAAVLHTGGEEAKLQMLGREVVFRAKEPIGNLSREAVVGIRPEFLPISRNGPLEGKIYSTLPAGMETTVKATCSDIMLTSVVFGSVDYPIDSSVRMDVTGSKIVLFDKESGKNAGVGELLI